MGTNMLSSKKVKLHGMKSNLWGTKDKILQYKQLVTLYARDRKILESDESSARKKLNKEISNLRNEIEVQRKEFENVVQGDRQRLRNTLADNKKLQLAYQQYHPTKVIEVLYQYTFLQRKVLDRLKYETKTKTEELIALKLEYADLEDRIKFESKEKIPEEEQAQIITAKVQDALLKHETALEVQFTYKSILSVLQKDTIYFDAVLAALYVDGFNQGKCILKVTEMGQMATEYLDDKRDEYNELEKILKVALKEREKSVKQMQEKIDNLNNNVKYLIRRDSIIELDEDRTNGHVLDEKILLKSIRNIEKTLSQVRDLAGVTFIEEICPKAADQTSQRARLLELLDKSTKERDRLLVKLQHAEEMFNSVNHNMVESTFWYMDEKVRLREEIKETVEENEETEETIRQRGELFIKVRSSLQQLAEILRVVSLHTAPISSKKTPRTRTTYGEIIPVVKPETVETNASILITDITKKLQALISSAGELQMLEPKEEAVTTFQNFVTDMTVSTLLVDTGKKDESLIDDVQFDDPQVPSRIEIKKISAEICQKNAKQEWEM